MQLFLNNVGVIKESTILMEGLTVITGKNQSGKTTIGKTIYSLLSASENLEEAFESSKRTYIYSQLNSVERILRVRMLRGVRSNDDTKYNNQLDEVLTILRTHRFRKFDNEKLIVFLFIVRDTIKDLTPEKYVDYIKSDEFLDRRKVSSSFINALVDNFYDLQKKALDICSVTIELIQDKNAFLNFLKDRTSAFLVHEFDEQIKPIKYKNYTSKIELYDKGNCIVKARVRTKKQVEFLDSSSFVYPYDKCIFIDNPFIVDKLKIDNELYHSMYREYYDTEFSSLVSSEDIEDHDELLKELLTVSDNKNFFSDAELQIKYKNVFEKINEIIPGEFAKTSKGYFYVDDGARLSIKNLATGSKMFLILKNLLMNGWVDKDTLLILDEPESHLHPEWINKFAQILVLLAENIGVCILLTTHSPNLMLALNVYSKKMNMENKSHFYLAEKLEDNYFTKIKCIDDSIGEGYSHLSLPLIDMNLELDQINGD